MIEQSEKSPKGPLFASGSRFLCIRRFVALSFRLSAGRRQKAHRMRTRVDELTRPLGKLDGKNECIVRKDTVVVCTYLYVCTCRCECWY